MNFPTMVMRVIINHRDRGINLWLPLFIIGPFVFFILFAIYLLLLPLMVLASILLWRLDLWKPYLSFWHVFFTFSAALRGFEVDINNENQIYIAFE